MTRINIFLIPFIASFFLVSGQMQNIHWTQLTVDHGLPTNRCFDLAEDDFGYIWMATDRGLVRYDGYHFKLYGPRQGLYDINVVKVRKDPKGRIWAYCNRKLFFIYNFQKDTFIAYPHNELLNSLTPDIALSREFVIDSSENLYIPYYKQGIFCITPDGKIKSYLNPKSNHFISFKRIGSDILTTTQSIFDKTHSNSLDTSPNPHYVNKIIHNGVEYPLNLKKKLLRMGDMKFLSLREDTLICQPISDKNSFIFTNAGLLNRLSIDPIQDLFKDNSHKLWVAYLTRHEVILYDNAYNFSQQKGKIALKNIIPTSILQSKSGAIIVTTYDAGIFYGRQNLQIKPTCLNSQYKNISNIQWDSDSTFYFLMEEKLFKGKWDSDLPNKIRLEANNNIFNYTYDSINARLFINSRTKFQLYNVNKSIIKQETFPPKFNANFIRNVIPSPDGQHYYFLYFDWIERYSASQFNLLHRTHRSPTHISHSLEYYQGRIFLGGTFGFAEYKNNEIVPIYKNIPDFRLRVSTIAKLNNYLLIGTQGAGIIMWDGNKVIHTFNTENGLLSNSIEHLHCTASGELLVSTYAGLTKITGIGQNIKITNYTTLNGLPSNSVNECSSRNGKILIATAKGLATFNEDFVQQEMTYVPIIEKVAVNGLPAHHANFLSLKHNKNSLTFYFKSLDIDLMGDIQYEYKLNDQSWVKSKATYVQYPALQPGEYSFAVRAKNKYEVWSEAAIINFKIETPWWNSIWFYIGLSLTVLYSAFYVLRRKGRNDKARLELQQKLNALQQSALQAQMNPHFIFNCLGAIQNFIMQNKKEDAMEYLAKFAKLIRENLNASTASLIVLDKEIMMLTHYLELEKLRYNQSFNYYIHTDQDIPLDNTFIPPLLIQPFVENAVIHGLKQKKNGGIIKIDFKKLNDQLLISIKDNGQWTQTIDPEKEYKSMGINITQKRLDFINKGDDKSYSIEKIHLETGSEIIVKVKFHTEYHSQLPEN